ncbi:transient receptor potential cation channel subfamily A member 1 isoform X1 [Astyanax mexicanus]|uniref:Transient receptor potential cation channel subfamily A member 1 isoform X1 n=1 Tax=Astyanax mexicanus TaxID=7994 RepID=A0A8T2MJ74_ASTMX|nr:transient receptor potential cation channel subfamily A member 1 isoform X1 [Astyanax mexicanus]
MKESSSYCCVIEEDDMALAMANVFEWSCKGNISSLEFLSQKNPELLKSRDECGAGPIHHAAASANLAVIRLIVTVVAPEELNTQDDHGRTPLHWAVEKNQEGSCSLLLELGADPNILNLSLTAPLHLAISLEHNNLVQLLLLCDRTDVDLEGDLGNTPAMVACSNNNCQALQILFKYNAKLCHQNKLGHFAIHTVAFAGAKEAMEVILQKGEEMGITTSGHINYLDKSKSSPLHLAVRGGNTEVIKLCISKGAKVDQQQCDKSTALHFACTQGATEAVKIMLQPYERMEEIINIRDGANQTPLHRATLFDHVELAEYLVSKGADIDCIDCKGLSPLLLATTCSAWKTVSFLLLKGADFRVKDKAGRNFLHLVIFQPKGLKNLPENLLQSKAVRELMSDEDYEGCTPLHYACKLGIHDSVKNMLSQKICLGRKSKQKKSGLHFAAEYGRLNTCIRLLETISDSRLLNEGEENGLTPLHLASRGGHTKVVELLLRRGALFQSDYKGWSCLHHAAAEGYTQTMVILLAANVKLLDYTNEEGNTALHLAARAGHVAAVKLLLNRGALFMLNKNGASFLHEAVRNGKKEVANAAIENERSSEALSLFKKGPGFRCVVLDLIEFLPESTKHLLDLCMVESEHDPNNINYHITYNFKWLQAPILLKKYAKTDKSMNFQPLAALNAMVQYNRLELLTHPVCQKYLEMKWKAYGSKVHLLNLAVYLLGLLPLTYLIINLKPTQNTSVNGTTVTMASVSFRTQSYMISVCIVMVLVMNVYAICKELVQLAQQRLIYFMDSTNVSDWASAISSLVFVIPLFFSVDNKWHWEAGALAILFAWINFLLYFQRFERFGIYVVMFGEIIKTLISTIVLFVFLLLAFGLSFYALMLHRVEFNSISLSLAQTFVMTVGELNYQNTLLEAYEQGQLAFPEISYFIFVLFVLLMPILLMNLMIGLAVGDIAEVQRNATLKRIAMQINLHTNLEEKLPYWYMKRVDKPSITIYPNKKCEKVLGMIQQFWNFGEETEVRVRLNTNARKSCPLEREIMKQKYRLKEISSVLEKQHNLLKLIIQKMEITSEADEHDGPQDFRAITSALPSSISRGSRWVPLIRALGVKK